MNEETQVVTSTNNPMHISVASYVVGFVCSLILTSTAFALVHIHVAHHHTYPTDTFMNLALPILALVQFFVQLFFFLHIGKETKPRWKLLVLAFMILIVFILVFGSLWIMNNLNRRMTPQQVNQYLTSQDGGV